MVVPTADASAAPAKTRRKSSGLKDPSQPSGSVRIGAANDKKQLSHIQEQQEKILAAREQRKAQLDARHYYLIDIVATCVGLDQSSAVEFLLEGSQIEKMNSFFEPRRGKALIFYFQEEVSADIEQESRRNVIGKSAMKSHKKRLFITDGRDVPLRGMCMFFVKTNNLVPVTNDNIAELTYFQSLDPAEGGLLGAIQAQLTDIYLPAVKRMDKGWGELAGEKGEATRTKFINDVEGFVHVLHSAASSLSNAIELAPCETFDLSTLKTANDFYNVAQSFESMEKIEACIAVWIKQIAQVLAESEQMRRESDNIGPRAELQYWKERMAKFNSLIDQIKSKKVKTVLVCLQVAKSSTIKQWQEMDAKITTLANEAKDNVKYLYTLEKYCDPLYNSDPVSMVDAIPGLINAIRMIYTISHFYNTSERMTSLFIKVTNQMITACKSYITCNGTETIWSQDREVVISKLKVSVQLNAEYQKQFRAAKQRLEAMKEEKKFDFSEMYVFGKFDTFVKRINKIMEMFAIMESFETLGEAKIEGLEGSYTKYQAMAGEMRGKKYDFLDARRPDFDADFEEMKRKTSKLQEDIRELMLCQFERGHPTSNSLKLAEKYEKLGLPELYVSDVYGKILVQYGREIENINKIYSKQKADPPININYPPIAGKITWARTLFRRINVPIWELQEKAPQLMESPEGKKHIKCYNRLAKVLLEYEMLHHAAWLKQIDVIQSGIQSTILVRDKDSDSTGEIHINFDPEIFTLIREAELLIKMDLDVPERAHSLLRKQFYLLDLYNQVQNMLQRNRDIRERIPPMLRGLFGPHLTYIDRAIQPGFIKLTWSSVNVEDYLKKVHVVLDKVDLLITRCQDLISHRIEGVLKDMMNVPLVEMSDDEPWTIEQFNNRTMLLCAKGTHSLHNKSKLAEESVQELINLIMTYDDPSLQDSEDESQEGIVIVNADNTADDFEDDGSQAARHAEQAAERKSTAVKQQQQSSSEQQQKISSAIAPKLAKKRKEYKQQLEEEAFDLLNQFEHKHVEALCKLVRHSLDVIKRRISTHSVVSYGSNRTHEQRPFFRADVTLQIPNVIMLPTLEEVQQSVNKAAQTILSVSKGVSQWSKQRKSAKQQDQERISAAHGDTIDLEEESRGRLSRKASTASMISHSSDSASHAAAQSWIFNKTIEVDGQTIHVTQASKNYYRNVAEQNKDVLKLMAHLQTAVNSNKKEVQTAMESFDEYKELWATERSEQIQQFLQGDPTLQDFNLEIIRYRNLDDTINEIPMSVPAGPISLYTERLKAALRAENKKWIDDYAHSCNLKFKKEMDAIFAFIEDQNKKLSREIKDLDDIRLAMDSLRDIRENEIRIDMMITPVEESYAMLMRYEIPVAKEEADRCDSLTFAWKTLKQKAFQVQCHLSEIQPNFKGDLLAKVLEFKEETSQFYDDYDVKGPLSDAMKVDPRAASDSMLVFQNRFDALKRSYDTYHRGEQLFGLPQTEFPRLLAIEKELRLLNKLYGLYNNVMDCIDVYKEKLWADLNVEEFGAELNEYLNRCRKLPKGLKDYAAYDELKTRLDEFTELVPLLEMMANKSMQRRHWDRISTLVGRELDFESDSFSMKSILECDLYKHREDIEDICISANKEKDIESKLKQIEAEWNTHVFMFATFKNRGNLLLRGDQIQVVNTAMEDSLMVLSSLLSNRYNAPFKKKIQQWVTDLSNTQDILEVWMQVQNLWVYLEAVFVGGDIAKQLPQEAKRFTNIDKSWVKIMTKAQETTNVKQCCTADDTLQQLLPHLLEQLELCQKSLTGYLEKKRLLFPRFFFVSDPALLEILGQASDPQTIQNHLLSIFDNTKHVKFHDKNKDLILKIISSEGEEIELERPVKCENTVEQWLTVLLHQAQHSLHGVIRTASVLINDQNFNFIEFLNNYPAQIGLLGIQLLWTRDAHDALSNTKFDRNIMKATNQRFLDMLNTLINQTTRDLESVWKYERRKYETLITIHVHQRDIFNDLTVMRVRSPADFEWLKQCRFYFVEDIDKLEIRITDVTFNYQNEFVGCTERLVITPLTDRCYITIAQALGMSMGAAPAGPAGTGKTETTKDMGRCLGKYVVVFNCSDQMDFRGLGRIYKGLAQSGSWGCFDEFNRIELPVLSVAAQQIAIVLACKKDKKRQFIFSDGDIVDMNPEFGIFLTMNPGYAGRQELPENLKIMFRTVAMMVPDRAIIIRVKLASAGFLENIDLARKFFTLYKLCEEQLSKQVHYDFGLRNILSVLRTLGSEKRKSPNDPENKTVMRVLRDMNLSKLIDEDEGLFQSLIDDLFPGMVLDKKGYPEMEATIAAEVAATPNLVNYRDWNLKLIQLFETQRVRWGIMALGPTGAGKTQCINILLRTFTKMGTPHKEMRMNPKAITAPQMFGRLDVATNDWTDGIFSTLWRKTHKARENEHIWIVLDGPVDAIWIENLNSVLDDNRSLTLANGDRIPMAATCKVIFEPDNIDNASPATVSRNGMVFMSSSVLNWDPILSGWLRTRKQGEADTIKELFSDSFQKIYEFSVTSCVYKMKVLECIVVAQMIRLMEGLLPSKEERDAPVPKREYLQGLYAYCIMWGIGAFLEWDDRAKLETFLREDKDVKGDLKLPVIPPGSEDTMYDYFVTPEDGWVHWRTKVEDYHYPSDHTPEFNSILVPNVDNVRTSSLISTIANQGRPVLLIGEQGTAKTVMIKGNLGHHDPELHLAKSFNFSSATTPLMFQRTIESYIEKRMGSTYGPPAGKKMTIFIDDINMPVINDWGDQVTNEIVRQTSEMGGFYNLEKPGDFTTIVDVQFMAAMIHPGGGRNDIPMRLKRQFCIFNCTLPSNASIEMVFTKIGCGHYCAERGFTESVRNLVVKLVPLTRRLWQLTKGKMLPTPSKFHYVFNLRDLSRIWQGMINTNNEVVNSEKILINLWKHECQRVISDRFVDEADTKWFLRTMDRVVEEFLGDQYKSMIADQMYFVDFLRDMPEATGDEPDDFEFEAPKIYEPIESFESLNERLNMFLAQYNENARGAQMDLVFFRDAMIHLMRVSRIIRTPQGNALLVGVGGSGKQSLTRLASFIAGYFIFQIVLTRAYNATNLMEDLKGIYKRTGVNGQGNTFIFTDQEIKDEGFLEYFNNILSSGEVSNLFARDEMDEMCNELIPVMKKEMPRLPPTQENLYNYFISRARKNLHVVLCFSPVGEKFRSRALKFPGLISGCTMDWFQKWPNDALVAVSRHFIQNYEIQCEPQVKENLIVFMGNLHDGVADKCVQYFQRYRRATHVTPKSYLSFLSGYKEVYTTKLNGINANAHKMAVGLDKLVDAEQQVEILSKELAVKEVDLEAANKAADIVLERVKEKATAAEAIKASVKVDADKAREMTRIIEEQTAIAMGKLEDAKPAIQAAEDALKTIKASDIATVKKLGTPPFLIKLIMDCVCILFQRKLDPVSLDPSAPEPMIKPSWNESLKLMGDPSLLKKLQEYDKDKVNEEMIELLQPYFDFKDFNHDRAVSVCGNVAGLLDWNHAMASFYQVNKEVIPLKDNLTVMQKKLNEATAKLEEAEGVLAEKQAELDAAQAEFDEAMSKKQLLLDDAEACRKKMDAASSLIDGLGGERKRWTMQSKEFKEQIKRLVGDVLLGSAFLSYSGPFNQEYRGNLTKGWGKEMRDRKIPYSLDLNLIDMLADPPTIGEWNLQGLPNDELSIQNGIIVTKALRYPLLIDPQTQGKNWIRNKEAAHNLQITSLHHKYFRNHLEDSLALGRPLLIEDIDEELDPALDNILEKNFFRMGKQLKVKVGDKEVDIMDGFYLYITTKLPNPRYTPEISARTCIIDFTVTMKGLEDQLLGMVIQLEKKELEEEKTRLMEDVTTNKRIMQQLEDDLLKRLTETQGSLVDDEGLITVLRDTKKTSEEVTQKLQVAAETSIKINSAREEFRPVASRGSSIYFLICEMSNVMNMYQTSLKQFLEKFQESIENAEKHAVTARRLQIIIEYMTYNIWSYKARGLYENHKLLFTLLLCLRIDLQLGKVKSDEMQVFIKGGASVDLAKEEKKPGRWIEDANWANLIELGKLQHFRDITVTIAKNEKEWKRWLEKEAPEDEMVPDGYEKTLDVFHRLLLIRAFAPDRTMAQARKYIADSQGDRYAEGVILDLNKLVDESSPRSPMIGFLSMGSDPTTNIEALAKKRGIECKAISMGQGQEVHARKLFQNFTASGGWVLLQNTHLSLDFMNEVIGIVGEQDTLHDDFRLWMTTEPHPKFPITLLQMCLKFTNEPPEGIKPGLRRTFLGLNQDTLDYTNAYQWKTMLYGMAFLHTAVQERRKFGPIGWNIPYEFNSADFTATVQFIQNHLDDMDPKKGVQWATVRYMIGEIQYGGRVTDDFDKILLNTFARTWFKEDMFQPTFKFYKGYTIPQNLKTVESYLDYISTLPAVDTPEAFGLHPNADITFQKKEAKSILDTILDITPKDSATGSGETREAVVDRKAKELLENCPAIYLPHEVRERLGKMGREQPMNIFLRQEVDRMNKVIKLVRQTLVDLQLAIDGTIIMNENLRDALDCLFDGRIPANWTKISWKSSALGFWFQDLQSRNDQFRSWLFDGRPACFWMTGFFNPQGFLTAMRQEVTRAHKGWALDTVSLTNEVLKMSKDEATSGPPEGVYIYGLFIEGAGWDKKNSKLIEAKPKVLSEPMPLMHISADLQKQRDPRMYSCPVYKKPGRTDLNFITTVDLKCGANQIPDYWVLRGVALLCDIN